MFKFSHVADDIKVFETFASPTSHDNLQRSLKQVGTPEIGAGWAGSRYLNLP